MFKGCVVFFLLFLWATPLFSMEEETKDSFSLNEAGINSFKILKKPNPIPIEDLKHFQYPTDLKKATQIFSNFLEHYTFEDKAYINVFDLGSGKGNLSEGFLESLNDIFFAIENLKIYVYFFEVDIEKKKAFQEMIQRINKKIPKDWYLILKDMGGVSPENLEGKEEVLNVIKKYPHSHCFILSNPPYLTDKSPAIGQSKNGRRTALKEDSQRFVSDTKLTPTKDTLSKCQDWSLSNFTKMSLELLQAIPKDKKGHQKGYFFYLVPLHALNEGFEPLYAWLEENKYKGVITIFSRQHSPFEEMKVTKVWPALLQISTDKKDKIAGAKWRKKSPNGLEYGHIHVPSDSPWRKAAQHAFQDFITQGFPVNKLEIKGASLGTYYYIYNFASNKKKSPFRLHSEVPKESPHLFFHNSRSVSECLQPTQEDVQTDEEEGEIVDIDDLSEISHTSTNQGPNHKAPPFRHIECKTPGYGILVKSRHVSTFNRRDALRFNLVKIPSIEDPILLSLDKSRLLIGLQPQEDGSFSPMPFEEAVRLAAYLNSPYIQGELITGKRAFKIEDLKSLIISDALSMMNIPEDFSSLDSKKLQEALEKLRELGKTFCYSLIKNKGKDNSLKRKSDPSSKTVNQEVELNIFNEEKTKKKIKPDNPFPPSSIENFSFEEEKNPLNLTEEKKSKAEEKKLFFPSNNIINTEESIDYSLQKAPSFGSTNYLRDLQANSNKHQGIEQQRPSFQKPADFWLLFEGQKANQAKEIRTFEEQLETRKKHHVLKNLYTVKEGLKKKEIILEESALQKVVEVIQDCKQKFPKDDAITFQGELITKLLERQNVNSNLIIENMNLMFLNNKYP